MLPEFFAAATSPWFARLLGAHPDWGAAIATLAAEPITAARLRARLDALRSALPVRDEAHLKTCLRQLRNQTLAAVMERDLTGRADIAEVMATMTALAELALNEALLFLAPDLARAFGVPTGQRSGQAEDLLVVAMGKLGGAELNVSSDIDLVFVYGEDGETAAGSGQTRLSNQEFFTRLARRLIGVLAHATGDGFVFRVDMRLRPNGESGPLVVSLAMLEEYFVVQGRSWERYAWIKARAVSGAVLGTRHEAFLEELDAIVQPFVYRRYLDFGAIAALRALHDQIRAEATRRESAHSRAAENVKLGRGGIREIEFIAQHFQLIRGGRDPRLRARATLVTLSELVHQGLIEAPIGDQLQAAYGLLRNVEHRLQYLEDAQTHSLPVDDEARLRLVAMCQRLGVDSFAALRALLATQQAAVAEQFDALFGARTEPAPTVAAYGALWQREEPGADPDPAFLACLEGLGYADPAAARARLQALLNSAKIRGLSETNRDRLDRLIPHTVLLGCRYASPTCVAQTLLGRLLDLLETIATRAAYLALLSEFPRAFERVAMLLAASPWAARYLNLHPLLLDELLDTRVVRRARWDDVKNRLALDLAGAQGDVERQMDLLREAHHAQVWNLLVQDLEGRLSVEELSDDLSALADTILEATLAAAWQRIAEHADEPCRFAVIAYGKLGGKELGYASDLDLIFLCTNDASADPVGLRYARLAQRLMTWLTTRTTAGGLFEIDLRLRPDGAAGLLVSTLDGFRDYQQNHAWVWEHQALTRARFCAGDPTLGDAFERERRLVLQKPRDLATLRTEIAAMRAKMHAAHPNRSQEFDLKHDRGGMVDIEFCVQFLVLGYGHLFESLLDDVGNIALLGRAAALGLVEASLAPVVATAYRTYRREQHKLRLAEAPFARVPGTTLQAERESVFTLCRALELPLTGAL